MSACTVWGDRGTWGSSPPHHSGTEVGSHQAAAAGIETQDSAEAMLEDSPDRSGRCS